MITKEVPNPNDLGQMIAIKNEDIMFHLMRVIITKDKIIQPELPIPNDQDLMIIMPLIVMITKEVPKPNNLDQMIVIKKIIEDVDIIPLQKIMNQ